MHSGCRMKRSQAKDQKNVTKIRKTSSMPLQLVRCLFVPPPLHCRDTSKDFVLSEKEAEANQVNNPIPE